MTDKTKASQPAVRRHSQVYVDVPHFRQPSSSTQSPAGSLKENTPLRPSRTNTETQMSTLKAGGTASKKRKQHDETNGSDSEELLTAKAKKQKVAVAPQPNGKSKVATAKPAKAATSSPTDTISEEYPNGYFYCHQCNRKRDRSGEHRIRHIGRVLH